MNTKKKVASSVEMSFREQVLATLTVKHSNACVVDAKTTGNEVVDLFAWEYGSTILYVIIENRAEFVQDFRKNRMSPSSESVGDLKCYVCPEGVITNRDLPFGWGLMYATPTGHSVSLEYISRGKFLSCNTYKEKAIFMDLITNKQ